MKQRKTFMEVLVNCDDQVLVRNLILQTMSQEQKDWVRDEFNKVAKEREASREAEGHKTLNTYS